MRVADLAALLFFSGCGPPTPSFVYTCADLGPEDVDAGCPDGGLIDVAFVVEDAVPAAIATGADFGLALFDGDSVADLSASPADVLVETGRWDADTHGFRFLADGAATVEARDGRDGLLHALDLTGRVFEHVTLTVGASAPRVGDAVDAEAWPAASDGEVLAGTFAYAWSTSDAAVATVEDGPAPNRPVIVARGAGTATVTVTVGALPSSVDLTVAPYP